MSASFAEDQVTTSLIGTPERGRRRGDAILIAFNHALNQGDEEVAMQLLKEYKKINLDAPFTLALERRMTKKNHDSVVKYVWRRFRSSFISSRVDETV